MSAVKSTILTSGRKYFDFINVADNEVDIYDIAMGLSQTCRYTGQISSREIVDGIERRSPIFYSVAQHSMLVADIAYALSGNRETQRMALMHDAAEAFLGDMTGPLKRLIQRYSEIEEHVHRDLMRRFGIHHVLDLPTKTADILALALEKRDLWQNDDQWQILQGVDTESVFKQFRLSRETMSPRTAYERFLSYYWSLDRIAGVKAC